MSHHNEESHEECEKIVHISSVQEINEDSIEFSLSNRIRSRIKCPLLSLTDIL